MNARTQRWYELFARGERDWLRHNEKVREAVRAYVPQLLESPDLMSGDPGRTLRVPLHLLEHARFRLADPPGGERGVGHGAGRPGDMLRPGREQGGPDGGGSDAGVVQPGQARPGGADVAAGQAGGKQASGVHGADDSDSDGDGGAAGGGLRGAGGAAGAVRVQLEFAAFDIMDWLWEELKLPLLAETAGPGGEASAARSGWDRQGSPSQLDRRRTVIQALKRRAGQAKGAWTSSQPSQPPSPPPSQPSQLPAQLPPQTPQPSPAAAPAFANDDLRFRRPAPRPHGSGRAVVLFAMDVSASMTLAERKLAKTFFHFTLHGLRRRYRDVAVRFLAHTTQAWEFPERDFFQISGEGGTQASSVFQLAQDILRADYGGGRCNAYLFYASDGENYSEDRVAASQALAALAPLLNYMGYVETAIGPVRPDGRGASELHRLFAARRQAGDPAAICVLRSPDDAWAAIRHFFGQGGAVA
jgi:uncharacterized sporulation protein YeaH/YhbH (DUF444 family)